jgi:hypothetical protein
VSAACLSITWRAGKRSSVRQRDPDAGTRELRSLKDQNNQLKREWVRKENALAQAAALLILQKNFHAL